MLEGYGRSGVVVYHGYVATPLPQRKPLFPLSFFHIRVPLSFCRETSASFLIPSFVFQGDSCRSSFFRGNSCPIRPAGKKLTVLLHVIGNLALCRCYSKTIALRTPVSLSFQLKVADMYLPEIKAMEEGLFSTRYGGSV